MIVNENVAFYRVNNEKLATDLLGHSGQNLEIPDVKELTRKRLLQLVNWG